MSESGKRGRKSRVKGPTDANVILVGSYRPDQLKWIARRKLFTLPIFADEDTCRVFTHCQLTADGCSPLTCEIRFDSIVDAQWLKQHKCPLPTDASATAYAIYECGKPLADLSPLRKAKRIDIASRAAGIPFPGPKNPKFTFIDLFAGIGGFRLAMQACEGKCVFTSEFDAAAQKTYEANYGEKPKGDITKAETKDLIPPKFDVICAGFPCQAFSLAGKRMGFNDNFKGLCRGTLFKEVVEICEKHHPKVVFCENVKGLLIHDKKRTLQVIKGAFEEIGYKFYYHVLNSKDFGVAQNRERVYMVAFRKDIVRRIADDVGRWQFPFDEIQEASKKIHKVVLDDILEKKVSARYYLSEVYMETLRRHRARHEAAGHGFGYEIRKRDGIAGAIVCGGMGRERNLVQEPDKKTPPGLVPETHIKGRINQEGIRKMTPLEWGRLQGFPMEDENGNPKFKMILSDVHLYKQFGNSVSVPVIKAIAEKILEQLEKAGVKTGG